MNYTYYCDCCGKHTEKRLIEDRDNPQCGLCGKVGITRIFEFPKDIFSPNTSQLMSCDLQPRQPHEEESWRKYAYKLGKDD